MSLTPCFSGRKVLVTGGAQGIGLAVAKKFLASGALVTIVDKDDSSLETVQEAYPSIKAVKVDLSNWEETSNKILALGGFHHLVNNAGIARPAETLFDIKPESVDEIFGINFKALVNVTQVVAKGMVDGKLENATIVNMSSISDTVAVPGMAVYSSSKAAVTQFTRAAALELAEHGIRVNCVRPAMVRTEHVGQLSGNNSKVFQGAMKINERRVIDRMVEMDEVADAVMFLSSSASSFVTGSAITLDGGIFIR